MKKMIPQKMRSLQLLSVLLIGLGLAPGAIAATTVLTFDDVASNSLLTNQYQGLGVTASGVSVLNAGVVFFPAHSGSNVAFSDPGLMVFNLDSSILGSITTVSAYVSGGAGTGIYAYDALGLLVGQAILPAFSSNFLLSVTSSGAPITRVAIHDGGTTFGIDDLTLTSAPVCSQVAQQLYDSVVALPASDFKTPLAAAKKAKLQSAVSDFLNHLSTNSSQSQLLYDLGEIKTKISNGMKPSADQTNLLNLVNQLMTMVKASSC